MRSQNQEKLIMVAAITFKVTKDHPDAKYVIDINEPLRYEDEFTFSFNPKMDMQSVKQHIKNELALVAGGGYSTEYIEVLDYDFKTLQIESIIGK